MKMLIVLACLFASAAAGAQTVWRCGADGRDYRDAPCEHGRIVAVADERSGAERSAAERVVAQERALAQRLERERLARERERRAAGSGLAGFRTTLPLSAAAEPAAKPSKAPKKPKRRPADADTYRATAPASRSAAG